jgi:hypothetical protein
VWPALHVIYMGLVFKQTLWNGIEPNHGISQANTSSWIRFNI